MSDQQNVEPIPSIWQWTPGAGIGHVCVTFARGLSTDALLGRFPESAPDSVYICGEAGGWAYVVEPNGPAFPHPHDRGATLAERVTMAREDSDFIFFEYRQWQGPSSAVEIFADGLFRGKLWIGEETDDHRDSFDPILLGKLEAAGIFTPPQLGPDEDPAYRWNASGEHTMAVIFDHFGLPRPPYQP